MTNTSKIRDAQRAQVREILAKAKLNVVAEKRVMVRDAKGRITGSKTDFVVEGNLVSQPGQRCYFRREHLRPIQTTGLNVTMPKLKKGATEVIVTLAA